MRMPTVGACIDRAARRLQAAGVEAARRESRVLLAHCLGVDQARVIGYPETPVDDACAFDALVARRAAREPLSRILGRREFWSLEFRITPDTLDPRPDSETLIAAVLEVLGETAAGRPISVLDLGTGSGCLLLALLHELPLARGVGIDLSPSAALVARDNAMALGLADRAYFLAGDWAKPLNAKFDVILMNPPYIRTSEIDDLKPEVVQGDPRLALDGGSDGLHCYRDLALALPNLLAANGFAVFEVGAGMDMAVRSLMNETTLRLIKPYRDLSDSVRCLVFQEDKTKTLMKKKVGTGLRSD